MHQTLKVQIPLPNEVDCLRSQEIGLEKWSLLLKLYDENTCVVVES